MKFLPLVWAGLWRRPVRSSLTALCIVIAHARREFLITYTRVRGGAPMPISALATIRAARANIPSMLHEI